VLLTCVHKHKKTSIIAKIEKLDGVVHSALFSFKIWGIDQSSSDQKTSDANIIT